jgi:hypothetical protein
MYPPSYSVSYSSEAMNADLSKNVNRIDTPTKQIYSHHTIYFLKKTRRNTDMIKGNE